MDRQSLKRGVLTAAIAAVLVMAFSTNGHADQTLTKLSQDGNSLQFHIAGKNGKAADFYMGSNGTFKIPQLDSSVACAADILGMIAWDSATGRSVFCGLNGGHYEWRPVGPPDVKVVSKSCATDGSCDVTCPPGYKVMRGGFETGWGQQIVYNTPTEDASGWKVRDASWADNSRGPVVVHAVCSSVN
jgi:hypothetical protein